METLTFKLPIFEGPIDTLLYLISKNKLSITDIPIAELLDQYLGYLHGMRELSLDISSEFLDMASRLVQIKTAMLLPRPEEEPDPREELVASLMEYQTCKTMAEALRARSLGFDRFVRAPAAVEIDPTYRRHHDPAELREAYAAMEGRLRRRQPPEPSEFSRLVTARVVSVASRVIHVIRRLLRGGTRRFAELFDDSGDRSEAVATFLAVLELVKSGRLRVEDTEHGEIVKMAER